MKINVTKSTMPPYEEYIQEISDIWNNRWLSNMGPKHQQLENLLENYMDVPNVSLFTNGHLALENAISALSLSGEVITTPFTFASTTQAIVRNGLTPVFCDVNPNNFTIDTEKIEELITEKTSAIIPVHVFGQICDVEKIEQIAKKHNLKVIYDAAHAFGVKYKGVGVGSYGDISMFSFHATKVFHTIEGGGLTYRDDNLTSKLNSLKNFGQTTSKLVEYTAGNAKMNEFQAAMGIVNLRYVDKYIDDRKKVVKRYEEYLSDKEGIYLLSDQDNVQHNYSYFPVLFDGNVYNRNIVHDELESNGIYTRKYFYPLTSTFDAYDKEFNAQDTPIAKDIADNILVLPLYPELELEDVDKICKLILNLEVR